MASADGQPRFENFTLVVIPNLQATNLKAKRAGDLVN
jgi:hypothetical protein